MKLSILFVNLQKTGKPHTEFLTALEKQEVLTVEVVSINAPTPDFTETKPIIVHDMNEMAPGMYRVVFEFAEDICGIYVMDAVSVLDFTEGYSSYKVKAELINPAESQIKKILRLEFFGNHTFKTIKNAYYGKEQISVKFFDPQDIQPKETKICLSEVLYSPNNGPCKIVFESPIDKNHLYIIEMKEDDFSEKGKLIEATFFNFKNQVAI